MADTSTAMVDESAHQSPLPEIPDATSTFRHPSIGSIGDHAQGEPDRPGWQGQLPVGSPFGLRPLWEIPVCVN